MATLTETRELLERATSNRHESTGMIFSLGEKVREYGSIVSTHSSARPVVPLGPDSNVSSSSKRDSDLLEPAKSLHSLPEPGVGDGADADMTILDFPEIGTQDEEFWMLNESLMNSFVLGTGSGIVGDDGDSYNENAQLCWPRDSNSFC